MLLTSDGKAHYVYSDKLRDVLPGKDAKVRRATEVEFNHELGLWEAKDLRSGRIIASGPKRDDVIKTEVELLEKEMSTDNGKPFLHRHS